MHHGTIHRRTMGGRMRLTLADVHKAYLPMSETAYYILLSLVEARHGYGIMQHVEQLTAGRLQLGPGTLYGTLARMEKDGIIQVAAEEHRRKVYAITDAGRELLRAELERLRELVANGAAVLEVSDPV